MRRAEQDSGFIIAAHPHAEPREAIIGGDLRQHRIALAADRSYLKSREAVLKFLYERHRFVEAAE